MTDWISTSTAELIRSGKLEIGDGYRAKNAEFGESGIPFLRIGNLAEGRLLLNDADLFPEENLAKVAGKVSKPGDCVIATKATIGRLAYLDESSPRVLYSPQVSYWRVLDQSTLEPRFIRCWLVGREFEIQAFKTKSSTSMADYINLRDQRRMRMSLPPLQIQQRIGAVVAAYDELIENNLRRIEILEEMAQAVYREWFVNFRYPGHEGDELVDSPIGSVPRGWEVSELGEQMELAYGKALKKDDRRAGEVAVYGSSGVIGWHDTPLVSGPGIVVGRKGNVGSVHWTDIDFYPIDTTFYVKTDLSLNFVFQNLQHQNFINSDAAVPGLNRNQAYANPLLVPTQDMLSQFDEVITPQIELRQNLQRQNANLRTTRDLLLPKLVSGEIDVSDLDIDTSWLAA